jgi:hypothetical protein
VAPCRTYDEALAYWFGRVNYELRTPQPGDLKLDRMRALLALLGNPHQRLRIVHVAGSKGKGSTAALLASVLREAGPGRPLLHVLRGGDGGRFSPLRAPAGGRGGAGGRPGRAV